MFSIEQCTLGCLITFMAIYTHTHTNTRTQTHTHTHTHPHTNTRTHAYTHTRTHTHTPYAISSKGQTDIDIRHILTCDVLFRVKY